MLLVIDVGNTNVVLGVYEKTTLAHHWRLATRAAQTGDEYGILIANLFRLAEIPLAHISGVMIASVVPTIQSALIRALKRYLKIQPLVVGPGLKTGIAIRYDNPHEVGADRIVNAVAAFDLVRSAAIVVDFGTATTFDLVSPTGDYMGGAIAPGLGLSMDALAEKTAKLPKIDLARPRHVIGRNTVDSMRSGWYWGYAGLVDGLIARIAAEAQYDPIRIIATGGLAKLMASECHRIERVDEFLTLTGLRLLYERNS